MLHHKLALEQQWADQVYNGRWFSPFKQALDAFMGATQQDVTGAVRLKFYKGGCVVAGRKSEAALYDPALATYENDDAFDQKAAKGFIDIQGLSVKTWAMKHAQPAAGASMAAPAFGVLDGSVAASQQMADQAVNY